MSVLNLLHLTSAFINILCIKSTPLDHSLYEHTYKPTATCKQEQQILTSTYIQNRTTHFFSNSCDLENRSGLLKLVPIKLSTGSHHVSFKHLAHTVSEIMPTIRPVPGRKHDWIHCTGFLLPSNILQIWQLHITETVVLSKQQIRSLVSPISLVTKKVTVCPRRDMKTPTSPHTLDPKVLDSADANLS